MSKHVIHKHSSQVVEGAPKLVSPSELEYGELALNYAKGNETLMFKNNQNEIVTFSPTTVDSEPYEINLCEALTSGTPEEDIFGCQVFSALTEEDIFGGWNNLLDAVKNNRVIKDSYITESYLCDFNGTYVEAAGQISEYIVLSTRHSNLNVITGGINIVILIAPDTASTKYNCIWATTTPLNPINTSQSTDIYWNDLHQANKITVTLQGLSGVTSAFSASVISELSNIGGVGKVYPGSTSGEVFNDYAWNKATGKYSHAEGSSTLAIGWYAHAEGNYSSAIGSSSHAEGFRTIASGADSHAEGTYTSANDLACHAEGNSTLAIGWNAHAEGDDSISSGRGSHAEGFRTIAQGGYSHSEGNSTSAIGLASHAEGEGTRAIGGRSHSEGLNSQANGYNSHTEGYYTVTNGDSEHASGRYNISILSTDPSASTRFTVGNGDDSSRQNIFELKVNGDLYLHGIGGFDGTNSPGSTADTCDAVSLQKVINDNEEVTAAALNDLDGRITELSNKGGGVGKLYPNTLSGEVFNDYSANAAGPYAHAEGNKTLAYGGASHSEGMSTVASGGASHAEGYQTKVIGAYGHAEGAKTFVSGMNAHAEGYASSALSTASHAEGYKTIAQGGYSHAEGTSTQANGDSSHAEGTSTQANGDSSHAEGSATTAHGVASHVEGMSSSAIGPGSHAEGVNTKANGMGSHSEGLVSRAIGPAAHAEGSRTEAYSPNSHAGGSDSRAVEEGSFAHGYFVSATLPYSVAFGQYNRPVSGTSIAGYNTMAASAQTIFSIGNGSSTQRRNLFEIKANGDVYIYGLGSYTGLNSPGNINYTSGVKPLQDLI